MSRVAELEVQLAEAKQQEVKKRSAFVEANQTLINHFFNNPRIPNLELNKETGLLTWKNKIIPDPNDDSSPDIELWDDRDGSDDRNSFDRYAQSQKNILRNLNNSRNNAESVVVALSDFKIDSNLNTHQKTIIELLVRKAPKIEVPTDGYKSSETREILYRSSISYDGGCEVIPPK